MSDEDKNSYPYNSDHHNMGSEGFPFSFLTDHNFNPFMYNHQQQPLQNPTGFDSSDMSFTNFFHGAVEYNTLSAAFDLSCSSSEAVYAVNNCNNSSNKNLGEAPAGTSSSAAENPPTTPNSSVSFPSSDAGVEEDSSKSMKDLQPKVCEDEDMKSKNV